MLIVNYERTWGVLKNEWKTVPSRIFSSKDIPNAGFFFQHFFKTQTEKNSEKLKTRPIFSKNSTFIDSKNSNSRQLLKNILSLKIAHTDLCLTIGA